jgi:hypothetical protein
VSVTSKAAIVAAMAAVTYWRSLSIPLISDDYTVISISRSYGEPGGWWTLASDALYRCRATFMILTYWLDRWFQLQPLPYNIIGVTFHVLNSLAVFAFGAWPRIGWTISFPAAIFFAVSQSHQEAVIWYSALPDQLAFLFVVSSVAAWLAWLQSRDSKWYAVSLIAFVFGLFSKESAIVAVPLFALVAMADSVSWRRLALAIAPFAFIATAYFLAGYTARSGHLHYNDGTFVLGLHFLPVIWRSTFRLLWPWGFASLAAMAIAGRWAMPLAGYSLAWIVVSFIPYAFLTYMQFVPSRHTYIASAGLAMIAACGFRAIESRWRPAWVIVLAVTFVATEWGYLWTRKQRQYLERAAPTEVFVRKIQHHTGDVVVHCFPYGLDPIVRAAQMIRGDKVSVRAGQPFRPVEPCNYESDIELIPRETAVLR